MDGGGRGGGMWVCDDEYGTHWLFRALACLLSTLTASQTSSQSAIWLGDRTILPLSPDFFIIHLGGAGEHNYTVIIAVTTLRQQNL